MDAEMPYFMTNSEWYYYDPDDPDHGYKLTDKAPEKARKSYEEFYGLLDGAVGIVEK